MERARPSFFERIGVSSSLRKNRHIQELLRAHEDLEKTLRKLQRQSGRHLVCQSIDFQKLVLQLSRTKRQLERKIGAAVKREGQALRKTFNRLMHPTRDAESR